MHITIGSYKIMKNKNLNNSFVSGSKTVMIFFLSMYQIEMSTVSTGIKR